MANDLTKNPIVLDTAGATSAISNPVTIRKIIVNGSGVAWSVVLHDESGGDIVFQATEGATNTEQSRTYDFHPRIVASGLYATTLTNITNVLVYV